MAFGDPKSPESKSSNGGSCTDVYDGPKDNHDTHSVFHTAADGVTTHDYERVADDNGNTMFTVDTPEYGGNVISGGEQYDTD